MSGSDQDRCLACAGSFLQLLISIPNVPALCNRLCASETEAANAPRGSISLYYCTDCGHVANTGFDPARVNYDGRFENALTFSPRYRLYANATSERLIGRYRLSGKRIVEIGCGGGDFLRLLCAAGNNGEGYDPSQPTLWHRAGSGSFAIIGRDFRVEDAAGADLVCCRQVLEHLPEPAALVRGLHETMAEIGGGITFFEVPNALFVLERLSIWDIIYEHVSCFTPSSLTRVFSDAGFDVCDSGTGFDDQYLWLEAVADRRGASCDVPKRPDDALYASFGARFAERVADWRERIDDLRRQGRRAAIWGAGAKGVMFANLLRVSAGAGIDCVVDVNPRKHGHFVPLTGQRIVGPEHLLQERPDLVIIMNQHYEAEIRAMIDDIGIDCDVVSA
jgi:SAM-dependent methyltransferase